MAGGVLPLTNDPMPNINTNKQGWGTDAAGTDLTEGDKYKDLINVKGAKFLDLTRSSSMKIDDADDLKDALLKYDVEMSIAFNDNPDNDEFRKAYIVVITGLKDKGETPVTPSTGDVKFAKGVNTDGKLGTLSNGKVETLANGTTTVDFEISKPDWAYADGTAADLTIKYKVYCDGVLAAVEETSTSSAAPGWTGKTVSNALAGNVKTADAAKVTGFIFNKNLTTNGVGGSPILTANDAKGTTVTVEITDVEWAWAVIKYQDTNGKALTPVSKTLDGQGKLSTDDGSASAITVKLNEIDSVTKGATIDIAGADSKTSNAKFSDIVLADASTTNATATSAAYFAKGGESVVITVDPDEATVTTYKVEVDDIDSVTGGGDDFTDGNGVAAISNFVTISDQTDGAETRGLVISAVAGTTEADAQYSVALSGAIADKRVSAYDVSITLQTGPNASDTQTVTKRFTAAAAQTFTFNNIKRDVKVDASCIKVTPVLKLYATKAEVRSNTTVVVTFSDSLANYVDTTNASLNGAALTGGATYNDFSISGDTLTLTFDTADLASGDVITLAADAVATVLNAGAITAGTGNIACTITLRSNTSGWRAPAIALT